MRVLLVEDDINLGAATAAGLRIRFAVDWVKSAEEAAAALSAIPYELVILDIRLPGKSGMDLLKQLREGRDSRPVLLLTARDSVADRVQGLNEGADDYLVKPFDLDELLARCEAITRRAAGRAEPEIAHGDLVYEPASGRVTVAGQPVSLSGRERAILGVLMANLGRTVSKSEIEASVYDWTSEEFASNTVEVHVSALRRKLGRTLISTIRGVGYMIEPCSQDYRPSDGA